MFNKNLLEQELLFKAVRSGGKGGQNVNKVATCVQLYFDISKTQAFDENSKQKLATKLANRISADSILMLDCSETRSQLKNKELVLKKFYTIIQNALIEQKKLILSPNEKYDSNGNYYFWIPVHLKPCPNGHIYIPNHLSYSTS